MAINLTPKQLPSLLIKCIKSKIVPFIHGSPACGKSDIVKAVADSFNLKLIDLRLSQCDPTDLLGMVSFKGDKACYKPFDTFPIEGDPLPEGKDGFLLFLDEANSASRAVQAAAFKLVLDRQVGQFNLHPNCAIIAAGNLSTDKGIVTNLSTPMQSRLAHFNLITDTNEWLEWAEDNGIDHRIRAYIGFRPDNLHNFSPTHSDHTFPAPRTWYFASKLIKAEKHINNDLVPLIAAVVGEGAAREFVSYCSVYKDLPTLGDIINDPTGIKVSEEPSVLYAITGMISGNTDKTNIADLMQYIKRIPIEFQIITLKGTLRNDISLAQNSAIIQWSKDNAKLLM